MVGGRDRDAGSSRASAPASARDQAVAGPDRCVYVNSLSEHLNGYFRWGNPRTWMVDGPQSAIGLVIVLVPIETYLMGLRTCTRALRPSPVVLPYANPGSRRAILRHW